MDLKLYYQKIRDTESKIPDVFPVIVSQETDDGGKAGSCAEVTRAVAAKMITEGTARLATAAEAKAYREDRGGGQADGGSSGRSGQGASNRGADRGAGEIGRRQEGQGLTRWLSSRMAPFPPSRI